MYTVVMGVGAESERALTKARAIAELPRSPADIAVVAVHASDGEDEAGASVVERTVGFFEERSVACSVERVEAEPSTALLDVASEHDADLVCVGGRQHSPAGKVQLRRGAQSVILNAHRPVLVAGEPGE